jgi:hypothetical protein
MLGQEKLFAATMQSATPLRPAAAPPKIRARASRRQCIKRAVTVALIHLFAFQEH